MTDQTFITTRGAEQVTLPPTRRANVARHMLAHARAEMAQAAPDILATHDLLPVWRASQIAIFKRAQASADHWSGILEGRA